jgi:hypothetical protein
VERSPFEGVCIGERAAGQEEQQAQPCTAGPGDAAQAVVVEVPVADVSVAALTPKASDSANVRGGHAPAVKPHAQAAEDDEAAIQER